MKKYYFDSSGLIELYEKRLDLFENIIDKMKKENIFVSEIVDEEIKGKFEKYIHTSELKIDENLSEKIIKNYIKRLTALHDQLENFDVENELEGYINAINDLNHRPLKDAVDNFKKKQIK